MTTHDIRRLLLLPALVIATPTFSGDFFGGSAVFAPVQTVGNVDTAKSLASPGNVPAPPGVIRVEQRGHHSGWETAKSGDGAACHFVLAFREPQSVGTCLFAGNFKLSYLRQGATPDASVEANWEAVPYAGELQRSVRVVALPPGLVTGALRLSGKGHIDASGRASRSLPLLTTLRERLVNVAPAAEIAVSSSFKANSGFRPDPRRSSPETLLDGSLQHRNWSAAKRESPISAEDPEWIVLDWGEPQNIDGLVLLIGAHESGLGKMLVQRFEGDGEPDAANDAQWQTVAEIAPKRPWRPPVCWEATADFAQDITTRALRLLVTSGLTKEQAAGGEGADLNAIALGEIVVVRALGEEAAPRIVRPEGLPDGVVPITFTMPEDGKATIRIVDSDGAVVTNLVNGESFDAGQQTVQWDLSTIDDYWPPFELPPNRGYRVADDTTRLALPATYRWEGIWHPGLELEYVYSYYPLREHGLPWITADRTGGWLADHQPPQTVVRFSGRMWVGTFCEAGHAILEADSDMRKLWGSERIWLACPRALARGGDKLYYVEQGGWAKKVVMIELDPKTKQSRRLVGRDIAEDEKLDIQGLAVVGNRAFIGDRANDQITIVDLTTNLEAKPEGFAWDIAWKLQTGEQMHVIRTLDVPKPGRMRPYDDTHLAVISDTTVKLLDLETLTFADHVTGLINPLGLAVDADHNLYVGEMAPAHQVKVFGPTGQLLRTIGKPGPHRLGAFDTDNLESPSGIDVNADGNVWVCELNHDLKRTSVWDVDGHCVNQVLGPTVYGGGGDIDPRDPNRTWYQGKEFRRDPTTGEIRMERIVWRGGDESYDRFFTGAPHNFGGMAPAYPFYHDDTLFFTSWQGWAAGGNTTLWRYAPDGMRPVAALGTPPKWLGERFPDCAGSAVFAWTDRNEDGRVQRDEVETGPIMLDGKPWDRVGATWQFRMNDRFETAVTDGKYHAAAVAWFHVKELTDRGFPVYALPKALVPVPLPGLDHAADAVYTDRRGNAIALDEFVTSMAPDGRLNWRYKSRWPGLHSGHHTSARGDEPGVLIAPTRFFGSAVVNDMLGEVLCLNSNLGCTYLMTTDGLYIDRAFQDIRVGLAWRMDTPPTREVMTRVSLNDEHFGGTFQKVIGNDGKPHFRYVVGKTHCSVVELHGLDEVERLAGGEITVTPEHLGQAEALRRQRALKAKEEKAYTISHLTDVTVDGKDTEWPKERIDGFALAYDAANLYVWFAGRDDRAPFKNATGDNILEAFRQGDVIDVKLQTHAGLDPKRTSAGEGDIRLSFAEVNSVPTAILYDYVVPGTPGNARLPFSSPWRTIYIDRVTVVQDAKIAVTRQNDRVTLEASVPLSALHLNPVATPAIRGDVGRVLSDQTGTRAVAREYWSNKATHIMSDVPSEAMLQPCLWGQLVFEAKE